MLSCSPRVTCPSLPPSPLPLPTHPPLPLPSPPLHLPECCDPLFLRGCSNLFVTQRWGITWRQATHPKSVNVKFRGSSWMERFAQLCGKMLLVIYGSHISICDGFVTHWLQRVGAGFSCTKVHLNAKFPSTPPEVPHRDQGLVLVVTSTSNGLFTDNTKFFADWLPADGALNAPNTYLSMCSVLGTVILAGRDVFTIGSGCWRGVSS